MKPTTVEWVAKAEGDFLTAGRELRARKSPNYDAVCFHAQQCAEKYLNALSGSQHGGLGRFEGDAVLFCLDMIKGAL
jgi:HEPN domain-containing protein